MSVFNISLKLIAGICCVLLLLSCSSSDEGGSGAPPAAQGTTVSGTATAPNGSLAKLQTPRKAWYARLFLLGEVWAQTITGFTPIQNATVMVFRIDPKTGIPVGPILAQTTTNAAGGYTLVLPLGVVTSSDLILQVTAAAVPQPLGTANTMSAPVVQTNLDVDPVSEGVMREVLTFVAANPFTLANFSNTELSDLIRMIRSVLSANPSLVGATIGQTIANIQAALAPQINNAIPQMASGTRYLIIFSTALPNGQVGVPYSQPILAIGAPGPLTYQVIVGTLSAGLALNAATGQITGPPTTQGTSNFTIQVSVAAPPPSPVGQSLSITIDPPPPPPAGLERVSVSTGGGQGNEASSAFTGFDRVSISRDGNVVAFSSEATNLVAGDTNVQQDIFVRVRDGQGGGTTTRVSVSSTGAQGDSDSIRPMISGNGRYVVFSSKVNFDPLDTAARNVYDIYRHDRTTGETRLVNICPGTGQLFVGTNPPFAATNDTGDLVVVSNGTQDVFMFDMAPGTVEPCQIVASFGIPGPPQPPVPFLLNPVMSDNGQYVAFVTNRPFVAADTNGFIDVYLADRNTNPPTLTRLTNALSETAVQFGVSISADGNLIAFSSRDPEAAGANGLGDAYVFDRTAGTKTRVSVGTGGTNTDGASGAPAISADGRFVAYESTATNIVAGDTNNRADIYVYDRNTGTTHRVSKNTNLALGGGLRPWLTGDGSLATFTSTASDLVSNDTNGVSDVFVAP